jgi:chlorobactene glucosyltransferase
MPELSLENILSVLFWSIAGLWAVALWWTFYCFRKQKPLEIRENINANRKPSVSIIVPARNEAHRVLEKSISSMLAQTHENYELIVLNDRSTDNTEEILLQCKVQDAKCKIYNGTEPDKTWLGKPFALQQALEKATGEWILSTDADIIFAPETLQTVIDYAEENKFDALTLIPKQIYGSFWEKLFMPVFGWFCLLAMPLHRVNDLKRKESMGVGNFFMFRREVLEIIGGFESVKNEVAEDLKLGEIIKSRGYKLRIDYAPGLIETRMYAGFTEIWEGFTKNLFSGMQFSIVKMFFGAFSILLFGVLPIFLAVFISAIGNFKLFVPLVVIYLLQVCVLAKAAKEWEGSRIYAPLMPLGLALFLAILMNSTTKILSGKGVTWKGRSIYEQGGIRPPV